MFFYFSTSKYKCLSSVMQCFSVGIYTHIYIYICWLEPCLPDCNFTQHFQPLLCHHHLLWHSVTCNVPLSCFRQQQDAIQG
jgi:hypothetical protein